jgi:hypothetical protein
VSDDDDDDADSEGEDGLDDVEDDSVELDDAELADLITETADVRAVVTKVCTFDFVVHETHFQNPGPTACICYYSFNDNHTSSLASSLHRS